MKIKRYLSTLLLGFLCVFSVLQIAPLATYAAEGEAGPSAEACKTGANGGFLGFPTWYKYLPSEYIAGKCNPVVDDAKDVFPIMLAVTEMLLRIVGVVSVAYVVYGSFRYILSQGQPEATKNARTTIINALIGVVISLIAASAVSFFGKTLTTKPPATGYNGHSIQRNKA